MAGDITRLHQATGRCYQGSAMSERTTSELIETLGNDIDRCHRELSGAIDDGKIDPNGDVHADYEYHARQLIRAIFAFIEAVTFSVKAKAAEYCLHHNRDIADAERFFAVDVEHVLTDKGEVVERPAHIRSQTISGLPLLCRRKPSGTRKSSILLPNGGRASDRQSRCETD
jgi:hypothetical protein